MGGIGLLLVLCLSVEVAHVRAEIHNLDDLLKEYFGKALNQEIESVDLSSLTVEFVSKVQYQEPNLVREESADTETEEFENSSDQEEENTFDKTYDFDNEMTWTLEDGLLASSMPNIQSSYTGKKGFDVNAIITEEDQSEQKKSTVKTLKKKSVVRVPAHKKVTASWDIVEKETEIPWETELAISGSVGLTCARNCGRPRTIAFLIGKNVVPSDVFTVDGDKLKFTAKGQLKTILGYSDVLKFETEDNSEETIEAEDEPTDDDLAAAEENPKLVIVKSILTIASDNIDPDSQWQPWLKMAGGIADLASGDLTNIDAWSDVISSAQDILESPLGQAAIDKLKELSSKVRNRSQEKATQINTRCKPNGRSNRGRNNGNNCPSRKHDTTRPPSTRKPIARTTTKRAMRTGGPTRSPPGPGTTTKKTTTKRTTTTRTTTKRTTARTTKKTTKRRG